LGGGPSGENDHTAMILGGPVPKGERGATQERTESKKQNLCDRTNQRIKRQRDVGGTVTKDSSQANPRNVRMTRTKYYSGHGDERHL